MSSLGKTTLALVSIDKNGERSFDFYRGSDADYDLDVEKIKVSNDYIIHFGSATAFLNGKLQETYYKLLKVGIESGALISFDPNFRDILITGDILESYKKHCWNFMRKSDFIKLSDEEAMLLTDTKTLDEAVSKLISSNLKTVTITLGKEGTMIIKDKKSRIVNSIEIKQKDSTGAGDAFVGGVLYGLAKVNGNIDYLKIIEFANIVGAITCEEFGAIPAIPTLDKVNSRI